PKQKSEKATNSSVDFGVPSLPKSINFFGQRCSLSDVDVRERLDREIMVNTYFQSSTSLIIKRSSRYFPVIESILRSEGVPEDFKYLCAIESNLSNVTSPAGAAGFWQFMPFTAPEYGLKISSEIDERLHLEKSTRAACKLIKSNYKLFHNWLNACAAYNRGPGGLAQDLSIQGVEHYFDAEMNPETARYVFRIMAMKLILENPEMYGYHLPGEARYPAYHTRKITITKPIHDLTSWALQQGINRKILRILNPWILGNQLTNSSLPCSIELPTNRSLFIPRHSL
ncbi:MAG: lytic transglycosylase domain-containing protein, partial [Bacteroidota bacterium]